MPSIQVNGVDLYYEVGGEGTPVVFIHGGFRHNLSLQTYFALACWGPLHVPQQARASLR